MTYSRGKSTSLKASHFRGQQAPRRQRARQTSSSFAPNQISSLVGWWDFADRTTLFQDTALTSPITADGQAILGVVDKSGAGATLTQATNGPAFKEGIQNSKSVAQFDGTNDLLGATGLAAPSAGYTIFVVFKKDGALTASNQVMMNIGSAANGQFFTNTGTHATGLNFYDGTTVTANIFTTPLSWSIGAIRTNSISSTDFYDAGGVPVNVDPANTILSSQIIFTLANTGAAAFGDYSIGEAIRFTKALTAAEMNAVGNYLFAKWNITWSAVS